MSSAELPPSAQGAAAAAGGPTEEPPGVLARVAGRFIGFAERWIPDAFIFSLGATAIVVVAAIALTDTGPIDVVRHWGGGFWDLLKFTMQMAIVVVTGYVLATTRPVNGAIRALAAVPKSPRAAVAMVAFFAMASSWLNWGFSLMFSAMLAMETARRLPTADYRALAAASFLGLGSVWAQGISGSAALQMATPGALPDAIRGIVAHDGAVPNGIIPLSETIFLWQSFASVAIELVLITVLMYFVAPTGSRARNAASLGIDLGPSPVIAADTKPKTPMEWIEHTPILNLAFSIIAVVYLVDLFRRDVLAGISLDSINLTLFTLGVILHWTPARLMRAVRDATPAVWGIILQFPLYAGIAAVISKTKLNEMIAGWFVSISTPETYPALIAAYSAVLGVFVPSGGGKWVIEAPYVMAAAHEQQVHLGWMVAVYDLGEALANLVQPFWMLPILALFKLRARDIMGYTFLVFLVLTPVVLIMVTLFASTLRYPL